MRQPFYATKEGAGSDANKVFIRANVSRRMVMHLLSILLWYAIANKGFNGFRKYALQMGEMADYATQRIRETGFNAWKNDLGLAVVFDRLQSDG